MIKFMIITKSLFHDDHDHNYDVYDHNRATIVVVKKPFSHSDNDIEEDEKQL